MYLICGVTGFDIVVVGVVPVRLVGVGVALVGGMFGVGVGVGMSLIFFVGVGGRTVHQTLFPLGHSFLFRSLLLV